MKRLLFLLVFLVLGCGRWGEHKVPLQFTETWVTGEADVANPDANGILVTIRLRLGDPEAFAQEFEITPPHGVPCQRVRILYRQAPRGASRFLPRGFPDAGGDLWSDQPQVCFHAGVEWEWRVLVAPERGSLPLDVDGRLVLISGEKATSAEEIAIVVVRTPESPADFERAVRGDVAHFVVARSQWLRLTRQ